MAGQRRKGNGGRRRFSAGWPVSHHDGAAVPETSGVFLKKMFLAQNVRLLLLFTDLCSKFQTQMHIGLDLESEFQKKPFQLQHVRTKNRR